MSQGRSGPPLFTVAAFWAFVVGGLAFGVVFMINARALNARVSTARLPGATPPSMMTVIAVA